MEGNFSLIFDIIYDFSPENLYLIFFALNFIFAAISYKLGFARKISPLKSIFVYVMLAIGVYIISIFSILQYPITESLIVVALVMGIYRFRLYRERANSN